MAQEWELPVFDKPDSQEICFVPNQDYAGLVRRRSPAAFVPGQVVAADGTILGQHPGHQHFTIGQRKGIGIAAAHPLYVIDIDPAANRVTLGQRQELLRSSLLARQVNVLSPRLAPNQPIRCSVKIRYNHAPQPATATLSGPDELRVRFDEAQSAITPGQAVVLYDGDVLLGGGWIESAGD
jgi:tRNA-specific 2-thiouridylase